MSDLPGWTHGSGPPPHPTWTYRDASGRVVAEVCLVGADAWRWTLLESAGGGRVRYASPNGIVASAAEAMTAADAALAARPSVPEFAQVFADWLREATPEQATAALVHALEARPTEAWRAVNTYLAGRFRQEYPSVPLDLRADAPVGPPMSMLEAIVPPDLDGAVADTFRDINVRSPRLDGPLAGAPIVEAPAVGTDQTWWLEVTDVEITAPGGPALLASAAVAQVVEEQERIPIIEAGSRSVVAGRTTYTLELPSANTTFEPNERLVARFRAGGRVVAATALPMTRDGRRYMLGDLEPAP